MLRFVLDSGAYLHQLVPVDEQLTMIAHLGVWYPDARKSTFHQQLQDVFSIAAIGLLFPHIAGTNLRCIADPYLMVESLQQSDKPLIIANRFDTDQRS